MKSCRIITGKKGVGKTTCMEDMAAEYSHPQGFISYYADSCYVLHNLADGSEELLMTETDLFPDTIGKWFYDQRIFDEAVEELEKIKSGTVFIDEVGRLELEGKGFAPAIRKLVKREISLVLAVRDEFVDEVISAFALEDNVETEVSVSEVLPAEEEDV